MNAALSVARDSSLITLCLFATGCFSTLPCEPGDVNCLPDIHEGMSLAELDGAIKQATEDFGPECDLYTLGDFTYVPPRHVYTVWDHQGQEQLCVQARVHPNAPYYFCFEGGGLVRAYAVTGWPLAPRFRDDLTVDLSTCRPVPLDEFDEAVRSRVLPGCLARLKYNEPPLPVIFAYLFADKPTHKTRQYATYIEQLRDYDGARIRLGASPEEVRAVMGPPQDVQSVDEIMQWRWVVQTPKRWPSWILNVWFDDSGAIAVWSESASELYARWSGIPRNRSDVKPTSSQGIELAITEITPEKIVKLVITNNGRALFTVGPLRNENVMFAFYGDSGERQVVVPGGPLWGRSERVTLQPGETHELSMHVPSMLNRAPHAVAFWRYNPRGTLLDDSILSPAFANTAGAAATPEE